MTMAGDCTFRVIWSFDTRQWCLIINGVIVDRFSTREAACRSGEAFTAGRHSWEVGCPSGGFIDADR